MKAKKVLISLIFAVITLTLVFATVSCTQDDNETEQPREKVFLAEDTYYALDYISLAGLRGGGGTGGGIDLDAIVDRDRSFLSLTKDGKMHLELRVNPTIYKTAKLPLSQLDASTLDVNGLQCYVTELFPGNTMREIVDTLDAIKRTLGISLGGVDFESDNMSAIVESLRENGTLPKKVVLPDEVYFSFDYNYEIVEIHSLDSEEPIKAVYVGDYKEGSEPYVIMTMKKDSDGTERVILINELLHLGGEFYKSTKPEVQE